MKADAQRIAIAEACRWKQIDSRRWGGYTDKYQPLCSPADAIGSPAKFWGYIPDYLNDLNAMHEAEKVLTWIKTAEFRDYLTDILALGGLTEEDARDQCIHATAAQRAEAFLRTINKWNPSPDEPIKS